MEPDEILIRPVHELQSPPTGGSNISGPATGRCCLKSRTWPLLRDGKEALVREVPAAGQRMSAVAFRQLASALGFRAPV
jgi:hypothetical protein